MSKVKNELEELSFRYLEPQAYEALRAQVDAQAPRDRRADRAAEDDRSPPSSREAQVPVIEIDGRIKRLWSISQKLKRQRIELEQVYDFIALRIITDSVKDCYAALGIIHQTWSPVPGRIKDFIAMPRPNGYQSLHTSVISEHGMPFEVQIRTHGDAPHGRGRHRGALEVQGRARRRPADERYFQWMRQLLEYQQEVRDPQEFIQNLKVELYPEEVYTFTPKGQVKAFPRGATPIDFAYSIHTDVGHQCVGARVNGKMVPLRTRLKNGDIVEIITQSGHKPSRDWLNFVVTSHARYKIKHLIRLGGEGTRAIELGRKVFEKEAAPLRPRTRRRSSTSEPFAKALADVGAEAPDDLFAQIGYGKLSPKQVLAKLVPADTPAREAAGRRGHVGGAGACFGARRREDQGPRLRRSAWCSARAAAIRSAARRSSATSRAAKACRSTRRPARTSSTCSTTPSGASTSSGTRATATSPRYTVKLTMEVEDRKGLLADVSAKIADINTNIKNMEAHTDDDDQRGADRHDGRDQRPEAPREGDQVAARRRRRARRRARGRERVEQAGCRSCVKPRTAARNDRSASRSWRSRRSRCARRGAAARPGRSSAPGTAR